MGKYVENNLINDEKIVKKATLSPLPLVVNGIKILISVAIFIGFIIYFGALMIASGLASVSFMDMMAILGDMGAFTSVWLVLCFVIIFAVIIHEIKSFFRYFNMDVAITNKRVIGKTGIIRVETMDAPLDKINNVNVSKGLFGRMLKYGSIIISTANFGTFRYDYISNVDEYKSILMAEIDKYTNPQKENDGDIRSEESKSE